MINFEKLNIFKIEKEMKNEMSQERENNDERSYTFKITKRRSPWTAEEDEAITALVNKYGTGNWTLIANEMSNLYGFKSRSGKQCRERWHNHLDPSINKDYWTEKEENILFMKHMEYGNKWSDIAKFLPGRTDNAIKNHFYSKLRKFIRKILKQINKDNLMKASGVDPNKYNSDRVYKMIKKNKIPYNSLNKDTILQMIVNFEKNNKATKLEHLLARKTQRKKVGRLSKENLCTEKINKKYLQIPIEEDFPQEEFNRTKSRGKNNVSSLYSTNINTRSHRALKSDKALIEPSGPINLHQRSRRSIRKRNLKEDYIYDNEEQAEEKFNHMRRRGINNMPSNNEDNGKDLISRNLNIIINKSVLFKNFVKEEEERSSASSSEKSNKREFVYNGDRHNENVNILLGQTTTSSSNPSIQPVPLLNTLFSSTPHNNLILDDRIFRYDSYSYMDPTIPLISPINPNAKLYPPSTRNYFNIEMPFDGSYSMPIGFNILRSTPFNFVTTPTNIDRISYNQSYTPNKEISMLNKILINDHLNLGSEENKPERTLTPSFKQAEGKTEIKENQDTQKKPLINNRISIEEESKSESKEQTSGHGRKINKPVIDMNLVNASETGKIFINAIKSNNTVNMQDSSLTQNNQILSHDLNFKEENTSKAQKEINKDFSKSNSLEKEEEGSNTNVSDKSGGLTFDVTSSKASSSSNINRISLSKVDPANLPISPKSAFVKMK